MSLAVLRNIESGCGRTGFCLAPRDFGPKLSRTLSLSLVYDPSWTTPISGRVPRRVRNFAQVAILTVSFETRAGTARVVVCTLQVRDSCAEAHEPNQRRDAPANCAGCIHSVLAARKNRRPHVCVRVERMVRLQRQ